MKRNPHEEAWRWYPQARDGFHDADELLGRKRFSPAFFPFQQSAEKVLKVDLYWRLATRDCFPTHSINELLRVEKLGRYSVPNRYPNGFPGGAPSRFYIAPEEAREAMELARSLPDTVVRKLEGEGKGNP
ncbi:MAG: HEPN domain-containing protein [Candidatus Caldatribacteriaceae bacterium]